MVLSRTYRIFAIFMALLLMVNTSGLTMDMHFCQGDLKRVNLLGKAKSCSEVLACLKKCGKELPACHKASSSDLAKGGHDDCCANDQIALDMDFDAGLAFVNDFEIMDFDLILSPFLFIDAPKKQLNSLASLPIPPLIRRDNFALLQTYLL